MSCTSLGLLKLEMPLPARGLWTSLCVTHMPKATA